MTDANPVRDLAYRIGRFRDFVLQTHFTYKRDFRARFDYCDSQPLTTFVHLQCPIEVYEDLFQELRSMGINLSPTDRNCPTSNQFNQFQGRWEGEICERLGGRIPKIYETPSICSINYDKYFKIY